MEVKFTANYMKTDNNFVIQNLRKGDKRDKYYPVICILKNILQRGCPTTMSSFVKEKIHCNPLGIDQIALIDTCKPTWINTIRGDEVNNYFPARIFYNELMPKYLPEFSYIQQLTLPEALINEITGANLERFINQRVDFYLPQAKLVIEIDGQQHKTNDANRINDTERDNYFNTFGITTVRIDTIDLNSEDEIFQEKIQDIKNILDRHEEDFLPYKNAIEEYRNGFDLGMLIPTAVIASSAKASQKTPGGNLNYAMILLVACLGHCKNTQSLWIFITKST